MYFVREKIQQFFSSYERSYLYQTKHKEFLSSPQTTLISIQKCITTSAMQVYKKLPDTMKTLPDKDLQKEFKKLLKVYSSTSDY